MSRRKLTLEQLSLFSGNLATCIAAGLDIPRSLTTCQRSAPSPLLREILHGGRQASGFRQESLRCPEAARALVSPPSSCPRSAAARKADGWTRRCVTSKAIAAFSSSRRGTMRNMWLTPLCLTLAEMVICTAAYCFIAPWAMTIAYFVIG